MTDVTSCGRQAHLSTCAFAQPWPHMAFPASDSAMSLREASPSSAAGLPAPASGTSSGTCNTVLCRVRDKGYGFGND